MVIFPPVNDQGNPCCLLGNTGQHCILIFWHKVDTWEIFWLALQRFCLFLSMCRWVLGTHLGDVPSADGTLWFLVCLALPLIFSTVQWTCALASVCLWTAYCSLFVRTLDRNIEGWVLSAPKVNAFLTVTLSWIVSSEVLPYKTYLETYSENRVYNQKTRVSCGP